MGISNKREVTLPCMCIPYIMLTTKSDFIPDFFVCRCEMTIAILEKASF